MSWIFACGPSVWGAIYAIEKERRDGVKPALNALTKVAALPGSGAGSVAALPAEKNETKPVRYDIKRMDEALKGPFQAVPNGLSAQEMIEFFDKESCVQMKASYFAEPKDDQPEWMRKGLPMPSCSFFEPHDELVFPPIDLGPVGGDGP